MKAKSSPRHVDALEKRLFEAEAQLWELSLEKEVPDMLLPPAVLRATFGDALSQPQPQIAKRKVPPKSFKSDISYLHEGSPRNRPRPTSASVTAAATPAGHAQPVPAPPSAARLFAPMTARPSSGRAVAPPSRADVHTVARALDERVKSEGETVPVFDAAFEAVIGQVQAGCTDRGALLSRIRGWMLQHVWWQEAQLRSAKQAELAAAARVNELHEEIERMMREPNRRRGSTTGRRGSEKSNRLEGIEQSIRAANSTLGTSRTSIVKKMDVDDLDDEAVGAYRCGSHAVHALG